MHARPARPARPTNLPDEVSRPVRFAGEVAGPPTSAVRASAAPRGRLSPGTAAEPPPDTREPAGDLGPAPSKDRARARALHVAGAAVPRDARAGGGYPAIGRASRRTPATVPPSRAAPEVLAELVRGERFDPGIAEIAGALAGRPITQAGLQRAYDAILPGYRAVLTNPWTSLPGQALNYRLTWLDGECKPVLKATHCLSRNPDDSLDLHLSDVWLDPRLRGSGAAAALVELDARLLRSFSNHAASRMTLRAGWGSKSGGKEDAERIGPYAWTRYGFDFADIHHARHALYDYGARTPGTPDDDDGTLSDAALQRAHFRRWLDAGLRDGTIRAPDEVAARIRADGEAFEHPWDIAGYKVDGVEAPVRTATGEGTTDLGKAYLLSGRAPSWDGARFVNAPLGRDGSAPPLARPRQSAGRPEDREAAKAPRPPRDVPLPATGREAEMRGQLETMALDRSSPDGELRAELAMRALGIPCADADANVDFLAKLIRDSTLPTWRRTAFLVRLNTTQRERCAQRVQGEARWILENVTGTDQESETLRTCAQNMLCK